MRAQLLVLAAASLALSLGACSGSDRTVSSGEGSFDNVGPSNGCVDASERACGITVRRDGSVVDCVEATQVCHGGVWGECGEKGPVTTKSIVVPESSSAGDTPGLTPESLSGPTSCTTNPCNPYCKTFGDTPAGTIDAGPDGLVYSPDGGITLPDAAVTEAGGTADFSKDPFASKAGVNGPCTRNADCEVDQFCKIVPPATTGTCTNWPPGGFNASCVAPATTYGALKPTLGCQLGDTGSHYGEYYGSSVTGEFDKTFTASAAIVAIGTYGQYLADGASFTNDSNKSAIKILDAKSCSQAARIPSTAGSPADPDTGGTISFLEGTTPLLVDLNGDGVPEVIAWDVGNAGAGDTSTCSGGIPCGAHRLMAYSVAVSVGADLITTSYAVQPYAGWKDPAGVVGRTWQATKNATGPFSGKYAAAVPLSAGDGTSPTAIDLNNDGKPEIVANGWVFNRLGQLIGTRQIPSVSTGSQWDAVEWRGDSPIVGDFDLDGKVEFIDRQGMWEAGGFALTAGELTGMSWSKDAIFKFPTQGSSTVPSSTIDPFNKAWAAVADLGAYGGASASGKPEIVWVSENLVRVMAIDGTPVMGFPSTVSPAPAAAFAGLVRVPGGGGGGINIADFDGDGLPEFGIAGGAYYTVYDLDCISPRSYGGKTGKCDRGSAACDCLARGDCGTASTCPAGVLWSRSTQDQSSFVTGSTVFDFNADGKAEVVYADECWTRVYDGTTGTVVFSAVHSSGTITEQPVVADVNLDGRADLVVSNNHGLETTPGEGMYCPTHIDNFALATDSSGSFVYPYKYTGTINIARAGTVTLRWGAPFSMSSITVTPPGKSARTLTISSSTTPISDHVATFTVASTDPLGAWTFNGVASGTVYYNAQVWEQGLAVQGSTEPASSSLSLASGGEGTDAQFAGLRCAAASDCPTTGMTCDSGFCRCTSHAQCGSGFKCINPPTGTPGSGMTCRPTRQYGTGSGVASVQMWTGPGAGWAQSRWIWNEHAYTPALVKDDGSVKSTSLLESDEAAAWTPSNAAQNSFRQQLQYPGTPASGLPDLTVQYPCKPGYLTICNRGAGAAPPGVMVVGFPGNSSGFDGSSDKNVTVGPCYTTGPLNPGQCTDVACAGAGKGTDEYMVNPACVGGTCKTDADCKGKSSTCNVSTGFCTATCTKDAFIGSTPPITECSDSSGAWSFFHPSASAVCGGSVTPAPSATFTRDFNATCPTGTSVKWGLFTYSTTEPAGANIQFVFTTAATQAGLGSAVSPALATVATPGYLPAGSTTATTDPQVCATPGCYYDLSAKLTPTSNAWVRMAATLNPNPTTGAAPVLNGWNVTYDCLPSE